MRKISFELFLTWTIVQEMSFKDNSYLELWQSLFRQSKIICASLVEGIMRNIAVKTF